MTRKQIRERHVAWLAAAARILDTPSPNNITATTRIMAATGCARVQAEWLIDALHGRAQTDVPLPAGWPKQEAHLAESSAQ